MKGEAMSKTNAVKMFVLLLILGSAVLLALRLRQPRPVEIGERAPDFTLPALTRGSLSLHDFGRQVVVLNFWATWCPPCRMEAPELQKVYDDNRAKKTTVQFLAVALDHPDAVKKFVRDQKITFPVALDEHGALGDKYRVDGIPITYFFDSKGAVAGKFVGARGYSDFQAAIKRLK
jgi:peroxiredoxin